MWCRNIRIVFKSDLSINSVKQKPGALSQKVQINEAIDNPSNIVRCLCSFLHWLWSDSTKLPQFYHIDNYVSNNSILLKTGCYAKKVGCLVCFGIYNVYNVCNGIYKWTFQTSFFSRLLLNLCFHKMWNSFMFLLLIIPQSTEKSRTDYVYSKDDVVMIAVIMPQDCGSVGA